MSQETKQREMRIVGYDHRLLMVQLQLLAAILLLPTMALTTGWWARFLTLLFFVLVALVLYQVLRLRTTGVRVIVEDVEPVEPENSKAETPAAPPVAPAKPAKKSSEPPLHWTDVAYPDPDVELGLAEPSPPAPADESNETDF